MTEMDEHLAQVERDERQRMKAQAERYLAMTTDEERDQWVAERLEERRWLVEEMSREHHEAG